MRLHALLLVFVSWAGHAQIPVGEQELVSRLSAGSSLPEKLLSTRSVVFYSYTMTQQELEEAQQYFQRTGIDAVLYIESDYLAAGRDPSVDLAEYLNAREINNIIIVRKVEGYEIFIAPYNNLATLFAENQNAWYGKEQTLEPLLQNLFRTANTSSLEKSNMLINEFPEFGMPINVFKGRRSDFFAIDLKVDPLAVPKFGDPELDRELEEIMKAYPYKYKLTEAGWSESQIRKDGSYYVLRFVYARDKAAHTLLGYDATKAQSAIVSVTYPDDQPHLKNIPSNTLIYKFYFKHIDSGNIFLGTKWDADLTWQQALINQIKAFKAELKIN
ncbi:MAG: hypothetical protein M3Y60_11155 [Bacteroidota bacterium]|nr:hypothetical protein [Bacteroidota bacterium]